MASMMQELFEMCPDLAPSGALVPLGSGGGMPLREGVGRRGQGRIRSYAVEQAEKLKIVGEGVPLVLGSALELYDQALKLKDERLIREAATIVDIEAAKHVDGEVRCEECGGVIPSLDEANPWHDPDTGKFGGPGKSIWSFHFKPGAGDGDERRRSSKRAVPKKKTQVIKGQPCGCEKLNASGKGCKIKHKDACKELAFGGKGKALRAARRITATPLARQPNLDRFRKGKKRA